MCINAHSHAGDVINIFIYYRAVKICNRLKLSKAPIQTSHSDALHMHNFPVFHDKINTDINTKDTNAKYTKN